jgi:vancomycin resistance protein VanJ
MRHLTPFSHRRATAIRLLGMFVVGGLLCLLLLQAVPLYRSSSGDYLRVMTYNTEGRMTNQGRLLTLISQYHPDLVMLQEVHHLERLRWLAVRLFLPHYHFSPYRGKRNGIGSLSRWPLGQVHVLSFHSGTQGKIALAAPVYRPGSTLWACSVHLEAHHRYDIGESLLHWGTFLWSELFRSTPRYEQVRELQAWLSRLSDRNWIIAGDFNTFPFSKVDRYLSSQFDDVLSQHPWGYLTGTYWALPRVPVNPRIDFIYHSPELRVAKARVIQRKVSDHFPILAIFSMPARDRNQPVHHTVKAALSASDTLHQSLPLP